MTHAKLLRSDANLAIKEGGMYYSGEYLSRIATVAESLEAENTELRKLCASLYEFAMSEYPDGTELNFADRMRELGIEVPGGEV